MASRSSAAIPSRQSVKVPTWFKSLQPGDNGQALPGNLALSLTVKGRCRLPTASCQLHSGRRRLSTRGDRATAAASCRLPPATGSPPAFEAGRTSNGSLVRTPLEGFVVWRASGGATGSVQNELRLPCITPGRFGLPNGQKDMSIAATEASSS